MNQTLVPTMQTLESRRPIRSRNNRYMQAFAAWLARSGVSPNTISLVSILFAALGAWALLCMRWPWGPWLCALCILFRLLCNLFDGMVAVEGGKQTPAGALFNEVPDRIADSLLIVALGYAIGLDWLGWCAALFAAFTAYIRTLGGTLGQAQDFRGPMAKPHRMWTMLAACFIAPLIAMLGGNLAPYAHTILRAALWAIAIGSALTCVTRLRAIAARLAPVT